MYARFNFDRRKNKNSKMVFQELEDNTRLDCMFVLM